MASFYIRCGPLCVDAVVDHAGTKTMLVSAQSTKPEDFCVELHISGAPESWGPELAAQLYWELLSNSVFQAQ